MVGSDRGITIVVRLVQVLWWHPGAAATSLPCVIALLTPGSSAWVTPAAAATPPLRGGSPTDSECDAAAAPPGHSVGRAASVPQRDRGPLL